MDRRRRRAAVLAAALGIAAGAPMAAQAPLRASHWLAPGADPVRALLARLDRACRFGCAEAEELRRWIDAGGEPQS